MMAIIGEGRRNAGRPQGSDFPRTRSPMGRLMPTHTQNLDGSALTPFDQYLREVARCRPLPVAEELRLARLRLHHGSKAAADRLARAQLSFIVKLAKRYRSYGLPLADLVAEGNVGLWYAVAHFDPDRGLRLEAYASWWVRAQISDYVIRSWSVVQGGRNARQKRLFFNLRKLQARNHQPEDSELPPEMLTKIATDLGVTVDDVVRMDQRLSRRDLSLDARPCEGGEDWAERLMEPSDGPEILLADRQETAFRRNWLKEALARLDERDRWVLIARRLVEPPATLKTLADYYGVSRERIRQIEQRALSKLQSLASEVSAQGAHVEQKEEMIVRTRAPDRGAVVTGPETRARDEAGPGSFGRGRAVEAGRGEMEAGSSQMSGQRGHRAKGVPAQVALVRRRPPAVTVSPETVTLRSMAMR